MTLFNQDPEKELTLREKQADINRKEFDLEAEKNFQANIRPKQLECDADFVRLFKVSVLGNLLATHVVDEERTLFASEPFLKPAFNQTNRNSIEKKVMELIKEI